MCFFIVTIDKFTKLFFFLKIARYQKILRRSDSFLNKKILNFVLIFFIHNTLPTINPFKKLKKTKNFNC